MMPNRAFWGGKTVCVTGGTGFVGFQIVQQLVTAGARVRTLALRPPDMHPIFMLQPVETHFGDVRDVAVGHLLAAERGRSGRRYIMGGDNVPYAMLIRLMASVAGMRPRAMVRIPRWVEWLVAAGAEMRAIVRQREPYPSFQHARLHRSTWFYDWSRAHHELGFSPRPLVQSLRDSFGWFAARHSLHLRGIQHFLMRPERR